MEIHSLAECVVEPACWSVSRIRSLGGRPECSSGTRFRPRPGGAGAEASERATRVSGQNAKTGFSLKVADMTQELEKVCFQEMRLPCQTPSAVTVTGA